MPKNKVNNNIKLKSGGGIINDATDGLSVDCDLGDLAKLMFGNGSDGDVIISVNTSLDRDMYYNNLTINDGIVLNPNGYRIFVKNILTNNGVIARNGNNASGNTGGPALSTGSIYGGLGGKNGGHSQYGQSTPGVKGDNLNPSLTGVNGVSGGNGGNGSTYQGGTPGAGGTATIEAASVSIYDLFTSAVTLNSEKTSAFAPLMIGATSLTTLSTSAASGSGGSGGGQGGGSNGYGGGSGGNGGIVYISAYTLINNGTIEAKGGNGGQGGSSSPGSGVGGGGGGGQGGLIVLIYRSITLGTLVLTGGIGGAIGTGGNTTGATPGSNGNDGKYIRIKIAEVNFSADYGSRN